MGRAGPVRGQAGLGQKSKPMQTSTVDY